MRHMRPESAGVEVGRDLHALKEAAPRLRGGEELCQHTSAYFSIRQHTLLSAYASIPARR
jgi:hypothetical protein